MNRSALCRWIPVLSVCLAAGCIPEPVSDLIDQKSFTAREHIESDQLFAGVELLTRQEAHRIALAANPDYRSAAEALTAARMRYYQAWGAYSPVFSAGTAVGDQLYHDTGDSPASGSGNAFYSFTTVEANWLIFDGLAREFKVLAARHGLNREGYLEENARRVLCQAVSNAFDEVLLAAAQRDIAQADLDFQDRMLHDTELKYRAGTAARSDLLNFEGKRNSARSEVLNARYRYEVAIYALAVLLGCPEGTLPPELKLEVLDPKDSRTVSGVDIYLDSALSGRPDLAAYRQALKITEYQLRQRYSVFSPTVSAFANYSYSSDSTSNSGNNPNGFANFYVAGSSFNYGIIAELTVFNGLIRYNQLRESRAQLAMQQYQASEQWLKAVQEVRQAHQGVLHNRQLCQVWWENRDIMREQRDLVAKAYLAGEVDLTRLNEAQLQLIRAENQWLSSRIALSKAFSALTAAANLDPEK